MEITIRKANQSDIESLIRLDTTVPIVAARADLIKEWVNAGECYVAGNSQPIGYAVLNYSFFRMGHMEMLMIDPNHRRKGVGQSLLRHLLPLSKTAKFWVTTNISNQPMQRLLEKEGFIRSGIIENIDEDDPELIYLNTVKNNIEITLSMEAL